MNGHKLIGVILANDKRTFEEKLKSVESIKGKADYIQMEQMGNGNFRSLIYQRVNLC